MIENIFAGTGIAFSLIGACFTVAASVQIPHNLTMPGADVPRLNMAETRYKWRTTGWDNFTEEEREAAFAEAAEVKKSDLEKVRSDIRKVWQEDRNVMVRRNVIGISLIVVGSVCQGLAIFFS